MLSVHHCGRRSVNAVLEAEDISEVILIGHSMGGFISTMLLRLYGVEKVKGVVYCLSFWLMPADYLTVTQRREWREALKDDKNSAPKLALKNRKKLESKALPKPVPGTKKDGKK